MVSLGKKGNVLSNNRQSAIMYLDSRLNENYVQDGGLSLRLLQDITFLNHIYGLYPLRRKEVIQEIIPALMGIRFS